MQWVVFDFDGTLCDISHRLHNIQQRDKDWDAFYNDVDKDEPKHHILAMLIAAREQSDVEIWTGRSETTIEKSLRWLHDVGGVYNFPEDKIQMRPDGNHTPDHILKEQWLHKCLAFPTCVFEDRQRVIDMWRCNGVFCFPVDPWEG